MFDSIFLSLFFHQETYPGLREQDPQVYKECLKHPESEKKRLSQRYSSAVRSQHQRLLQDLPCPGGSLRRTDVECDPL